MSVQNISIPAGPMPTPDHSGAMGSKTPAPVVWAAAIQLLVACFSLVTSSVPLVALVIGILLTVGLSKGLLIARSFVLLGAILVVVRSTVFGVLMLGDAPLLLIVVALVSGVARLIQIRLLFSEGALRHFGLDCPRCGHTRVRRARLFTRRLRCTGCRHEWKHGERDRIDVSVFD